MVMGGVGGGGERGEEGLSVTIKDRSMHGLRCGRQTLTSQGVTRGRRGATERTREVQSARERGDEGT